MFALRGERVHVSRPRLLLLWSLMLLVLLREVVVVSNMISCLCGGDEDRADTFCQDRRIVCTWGWARRGIRGAPTGGTLERNIFLWDVACQQHLSLGES